MDDLFADAIAHTRRLPIYVLIDISAEMLGDGVVKAQSFLAQLYEMLMSHPFTASSAWISVITYNDHAEMAPLVPVIKFVPPYMVAGGLPSFGAALRLLNDSLDYDLRGNTHEWNGDWRPMVILVMKRAPMDEWVSQARRLTSRTGSQRPSIIGVTVDRPDDAPTDVLQQLTTTIVPLADAVPSIQQAVTPVWLD